MNNRFVTVFWSLSLLLAVSSTAVRAQESGWPRTLTLESGSVTIYPLQVDEMDGDLVHFRAALAYKQPGDSEPVFGAAWFESRVEINREKGVVHPLDLRVLDTRFPEGTDEVQQELIANFASESAGWNLDFPLTELLSALDTAEQEAKTVQNLNTAPPTILYRDHAALLVTIDGEPVLRAIENSNYQAVINTPYPLIFDGRAYYLSVAKDVWYRAERATGPYRFDASPPADIVIMVDAAAEQEVSSASTEKVTASNAPEIVVATTPTELIVTEGPAAFVPLVDDLLVLNNSTDDVFMHINSQQFYVVLAGRWYQAPSLNGPWNYRAADELPAAFANIPQNSDQAGSRVYVAGTVEAKEAVLDAQIPQTAAVARGTVDLDVSYDGDPRFEPVEGTDDLAYAGNTGSTVLQADRQFYLVEDGVWYVSSSPDGPWVVSDYRPAEVASISPRSPVYNVKYVYIYDSTPEVVYVGYTPGYTGSYVYYNTIVYGTGWYYRPWISPRYYYPRYSTWGYNVSYDPWYGWNFGLAWGWGPFFPGYYSGGYWHHNRPWYGPRYDRWGPGGYRPRPHDYYAHGRGNYGHDGRGHRGHDDRDRNYYGRDDRDRDSNRNGRFGSGRNGRDQGTPSYGSADTNVRNRNLYRDPAQRARVSETVDNTRPRRTREAGRDLAANPDAPAMREVSRNREVRDQVRPSKQGRSRVGPVTPSDLRVKAQVRDAQREANQGRVFADNAVSGRRTGQSPLEQRQGNGWERAATGEVRRATVAPRNADRTSTHRGTSRAVEYMASAPSRSSALTQRAAPPNLQQRSITPRRAVPQASVPQPRVAQPWEVQRNTQPGNASPRNVPTARSPQRVDVQRPTQARSVAPGSIAQAGFEQRAVPSRNVPQRAAPQRRAAQENSSQRSTEYRSEQPRSAPPRNEPRSSTQKQSSPPSDSGKQGNNRRRGKNGH